MSIQFDSNKEGLSSPLGSEARRRVGTRAAALHGGPGTIPILTAVAGPIGATPGEDAAVASLGIAPATVRLGG
jgi:hypothetical protein